MNNEKLLVNEIYQCECNHINETYRQLAYDMKTPWKNSGLQECNHTDEIACISKISDIEDAIIKYFNGNDEVEFIGKKFKHTFHYIQFICRIGSLDISNKIIPCFNECFDRTIRNFHNNKNFIILGNNKIKNYDPFDASYYEHKSRFSMLFTALTFGMMIRYFAIEGYSDKHYGKFHTIKSRITDKKYSIVEDSSEYHCQGDITHHLLSNDGYIRMLINNHDSLEEFNPREIVEMFNDSIRRYREKLPESIDGKTNHFCCLRSAISKMFLDEMKVIQDLIPEKNSVKVIEFYGDDDCYSNDE
ncbi:MAG: hypothetical protein ACRCX2_18455 [Paraclostridium sp.]